MAEFESTSEDYPKFLSEKNLYGLLFRLYALDPQGSYYGIYRINDNCDIVWSIEFPKGSPEALVFRIFFPELKNK